MRTRSRLSGRFGLLVSLGVLSSFVAGAAFYGNTPHRKGTGGPELISVTPLPEQGEFCDVEPGGVSPTLIASLEQQDPNLERPSPAERRVARPDPAKLKPVRMIQDPYAALSAVAVDVAHNEVVMTDENLFSLLVYDRMTNTPPSARLTEPKRRLAGDKTDIEFQCGLYIDPKTGDIYATNNDTVDRLVIFSRDAKGNVPPARELHTPHGTFGIAMDDGREQMYLAIQHDNAIVVYSKYAKDEDKPIRLIQGDHTLLADPHGIALDTKNDLLFVTNFGSTATKQKGRGKEVPNWPLEDVVPGSGRFLPPSITVYRRDARGDAAPVRVIQGPKTQLNWATGITVDEDRNELLVANDVGDNVLIFDINAQGDAAPKRVLAGPKTLIKNPTGLYLDLKNNELWVTNFGNHSATVYARGVDGNTAPLRIIRTGPLSVAPMMGNPHPIAYDTKRDQILVPN